MSTERVSELERENAALSKKVADGLSRENDLKAQVTKLSGDLEHQLIDSAAERIALDKGAAVSALPDIKTRIRAMFTVANGKAIAHTPSGEPLYGKDGGPMELPEYFAKLRSEAPHLFVQRSATGASTGNVLINRDDAQDTRKYRAGKAEADRLGVELEIVENAPSRESSTGRFTLTRSQAQDARLYRRTKAAAEAAGEELTIEEDVRRF